MTSSEHPKKIGAGLLLVCQGECLLLKRAPTCRNPLTMGLPGGNQDPEDGGDLLVTALRESSEEMGSPPPHTIIESYLTKRGKSLQKHFTVFLAEVTPEVKSTWTPVLNEEHTDFEWIPLSTLAARKDLHPVVKLVTREEPNKTKIWAAIEGLS